MELDGEGAANCKQLKDLIRKECDKRDRKYPRLEDEYNKLEQQVTHKDQQKTWHRGANSQIPKEQAPRRKTNPFKNKAKLEETTVQKTRLQGTKINQSKETLKTKEKPSTKTGIDGKTMKTKRHRPHKPNQIGNCTDQLARKKHHRVSQEETNAPIWICCRPITFKPPQRLQCSC